MSTINMVKYYFYKGKMPKDLNELKRTIQLAYQTAVDRKLYPRAILIRSRHHNLTTINGVPQADPKGWHLTFCYKDQSQLTKSTHITCHGYTDGPFAWELKEAVHSGEKADSARRKRDDRPVWPALSEPDEAPEIGYGHLPQPSTT